MTTGHVRVRAPRDGINDGALEAVCTHCSASATLLMPMNADDFTEMLTAFLDHHEHCEKE
jgi:hypothetical protein